jgi:hypothetical protein
VLIAEIMMETSGNIDFLVSPVSATPTQSRRDGDSSGNDEGGERTKRIPTRPDFVRVILRHKERRPLLVRIDANGSARSIIDWGKSVELDKDQQRAFEVIAATFILTFHKDMEINDKTRALSCRW